MSTATDTKHFSLRPQRAWRWAGWVLLCVVLAGSFLAYLSPDMQLQWETLAALCGF